MNRQPGLHTLARPLAPEIFSPPLTAMIYAGVVIGLAALLVSLILALPRAIAA